MRRKLEDTNKDAVVFNPRSAMYDDDGYPSGGLLRAYKNFSDWSVAQQRAIGTSVPRAWHWFRLSSSRLLFWRGATGFGVLGVLVTIGLLLSELLGAIPRPAAAKTPTPTFDELVAAQTFAPQPQPPLLVERRVPIPPRDVDIEFFTRMSVAELESGRMDRRAKYPFGSQWRRGELNPFGSQAFQRLSTEVAAYVARPEVQLNAFQLSEVPTAADRPGVESRDRVTRALGFEAFTRWPEQTGYGAPTRCDLVVRNNTRHDIDHVRVRYLINPIDRVTGTIPNAGVFQGELIWDETTWPAGDERVYSITIVPDTPRINGRASIEVISTVASSTRVAAAEPRRPVSEPFQPLPADEPILAPHPDPVLPTSPWGELTTEPSNELKVLPIDPSPIDLMPPASMPPTGPQRLPLDQPLVVDDADDLAPELVETAIKLQMILKASQVGGVATIKFRIVNVGPLTSEATVLNVTLPKSLVHPNGRDLKLPIGKIAPGKEFTTELYANVLDEGDLTVIATTEAKNARREKARGVLPLNTAMQPGDDTSARYRRGVPTRSYARR